MKLGERFSTINLIKSSDLCMGLGADQRVYAPKISKETLKKIKAHMEKNVDILKLKAKDLDVKNEEIPERSISEKEDGRTLINHEAPPTSAKNRKWLQNSIFITTCTMEGKVVTITIDGRNVNRFSYIYNRFIL